MYMAIKMVCKPSNVNACSHNILCRNYTSNSKSGKRLTTTVVNSIEMASASILCTGVKTSPAPPFVPECHGHN